MSISRRAALTAGTTIAAGLLLGSILPAANAAGPNATLLDPSKVQFYPGRTVQPHGAIKAKWGAKGAAYGESIYGVPVTKELAVRSGNLSGVVQIFSGSVAFWSARTGAFFIPSMGEYNQANMLRFAGEFLDSYGFPTMDVAQDPAGHLYIDTYRAVNNTNMRVFFHQLDMGAAQFFPYYFAGMNKNSAIFKAWAAAGGAAKFGVFARGEVAYAIDPKNTQLGNYHVAVTMHPVTKKVMLWSWSAATGVRKIPVGGGIYNKVLAVSRTKALRGGFSGALYSTSGKVGVPMTDETPMGRGGVFVRFKYGVNGRNIMIWSPTTPTVMLNDLGAIAARWRAAGAENSSFGFPVTDETALSDGSIGVKFQNGKWIKWTAARGAYVQ